MTIDPFDRAILQRLQRDGRISNQDLAEAVNLSPSPCLRRVRTAECPQAGSETDGPDPDQHGSPHSRALRAL